MERLSAVVLVIVEVVRRLVGHAHHAERIGAVRGPVVLRSKADVAGLVVFLMVPAERIETWRAGLCIEPDRREEPSASTLFIAAPLPWLGTVVAKKPAERI